MSLEQLSSTIKFREGVERKEYRDVAHEYEWGHTDFFLILIFYLFITVLLRTVFFQGVGKTCDV